MESKITLTTLTDIIYMALRQKLGLIDQSPDLGTLTAYQRFVKNFNERPTLVSACRHGFGDLVAALLIPKDKMDMVVSICKMLYLSKDPEIIEKVETLRRDFSSSNALNEACFWGQLDVVYFLVDKKSEPVTTQCLEHACRGGQLHIIQYLYPKIDQNMKINLLNTAFVENRKNIVEWLMSQGIDIHNKTNAIFLDICKTGILESVKFFDTFKFDVELSTKFKGLKYACRFGHFDVVKWLVESNADLLEKDGTLVLEACVGGNLDIANYLYERGVAIDFQNNSPMIVACKGGYKRVVEWLILRGVDVHMQKDTPFRTACAYGHLDLAQYLKTMGVDVHTLNDIAFKTACKHSYIKLAEWLYSLDEHPVAWKTEALTKLKTP